LSLLAGKLKSVTAQSVHRFKHVELSDATACFIFVIAWFSRRRCSLLRRGSFVWSLLTALLCTCGCYEYRVKYDGWETFRSQIGGDKPGAVAKNSDGSNSAAISEQRGGWAIQVESFEGGNRFRRASDLIRNLTNRNAVTDLWFQDHEGKTTVYRGRYETLTDLDAQKALMQTRAIEEDGSKPYENVELISLGGASGGQPTGSADLRNHRGQGYYTLQIGFYDPEFGPDFRDAAEKAVATLRQEGHKAYYYHGPNRSMMTIDLFSDADFDQDGPVRVYGPRMLAIQEKFPNNLSNGLTLVETVSDGAKSEKRAQPSFVVKVP